VSEKGEASTVVVRTIHRPSFRGLVVSRKKKRRAGVLFISCILLCSSFYFTDKLKLRLIFFFLRSIV